MGIFTLGLPSVLVAAPRSVISDRVMKIISRSNVNLQYAPELGHIYGFWPSELLQGA